MSRAVGVIASSPGATSTAGSPGVTGGTGQRRSRLFFADHLRVALTVLVVLHHLAIMYGLGIAFYYVEPPSRQDVVTFFAAFLFVIFNQAYFMGLFFFISGNFAPGSFDGKGIVPFLKDRALRLLVPIAAFRLVLGPIAGIGTYQLPRALTQVTLSPVTHPFTWHDYPALTSAGPLWFAEMLLIFDVGYAGWRLLTARRPARPVETPRPPRYQEIAAFTVALAVASYLFRIVAPIGTITPILGFGTPAYIPQYVSFFVLGVVAARRDWFRNIPVSMGMVGFGMALGATILLLPISLIGGQALSGGGHWQSGVFALWDSTVGVGMSLGLITVFRRFLNRESGAGRFLTRNAFTVYVIHAPIIVMLALALRPVHLGPPQLLKLALAAAIGVPICFAAAALVRRLPGASRVL